MSVSIERMQSCWPGKTLRRYSLDDISSNDMFLELRYEGFVTFLPNVGNTLVSESHWWLSEFRSYIGQKSFGEPASLRNSCLVYERQVRTCVRRAEDVRDDL